MISPTHRYLSFGPPGNRCTTQDVTARNGLRFGCVILDIVVVRQEGARVGGTLQKKRTQTSWEV
jgi:hypothetical protein